MTDQISFQVGDVSRLLRRAFDVRARAIGVTRPQWRMLTTLARNEGANQGQLAELLDVEPISLCRMIDRLADSGLVERRADPADRRAWRIHLTDKAGPILQELRGLADDLTEEALAGLSDTDRLVLARMLERMRDNLANIELKEGLAAHG